MKPNLPKIELEKLEDLSAEGKGFLALRRERWRTRLPDGHLSPPFIYDSIERRAMHAVIILAHYLDDGEVYVYLRSCIRPPLMHASCGTPDLALGMWELPAGLVEEGESPVDCAARETEEELGFTLPAEQYSQLGSFVFPAPGMIAERQYFFHVAVTPSQRQEPSLDGSSLEMGGKVIALPLSHCLALARSGQLPDSKSELGLRRFEESLHGG